MMEILFAIPLFVIVFGMNTLLWGTLGLGRWSARRVARFGNSGRRRQQLAGPSGKGSAIVSSTSRRVRPEEVAVLIPAHNESAVIEDSLRAAVRILPKSNIHVISDGSSDNTGELARRFGVNVLELSPNRGKAGALLAGIRHFEIARDYGVVLLLDADTRLSGDYLTTGLPEFDQPDVVAVAGQVECLHDPPPRTWVGRILVAYRSRVYAVVQFLVKYGQATRFLNVVSIVPGFASMYRTDILQHIDIAASGLVIEDYNMTFEVHAKKLGRIAFCPGVAVAYTQDPDTLHDYTRQIRRWTLGFWQTVRRHRFGTGKFRVALLLLVAELLSSSVMLLMMLPLTLFAVYGLTLADTFGHPQVLGYELVGTWMPWFVVIGVLLPDLALTLFAVIALRRPGLLLLAPIFPLLRLVEAFICLRSIPTALRSRSDGRWLSPSRRAMPALAGATPSTTENRA